MRGLLGLLRRRSLLEWEAEQERYRLHDLVRAFAAARLSEIDAVHLRYARYYAQIAGRTENLYLQGGVQILAGLALFDAERAHIDAGWGWARERAGQQVADELLLDYANATAYTGDLRYHMRHERIPQLEAALGAARRLGHKSDEGNALGNLGNAYADLGEVRRAIEYYEQRLTSAREIGDRRGEGNALGNLGNAYANLGEVRRAIEYHEQHLTITREIGDRRGEGSTLGNLGVAYKNLGEVRRAIEYHEQHLTITREIGDRRGEGNALGNLGNAYYNLGEVRRALEYYEQSLMFAREIGDRRGEANGLFCIGLALDALGDRAQATVHAEAALRIYEQIESPYVDRVRKQLAQWREQEPPED